MARENSRESDQGLVVVVGGTGKTGRRVVERLKAKGVPVRSASRTSQPAFDWKDRSTWAAALSGASMAYVTYYPDLAVPGAADDIDALAKLAISLGVRRIVLLAGRGEAGAEQAEEALKASGADWTILRTTWFAQNFSENFMLDLVLSGEVALPAGDVREPFVDLDDVADVAVKTLTEPGHIGKTYVLTGPRALTFAEAIAEIAAASGRPVRYKQIPVEMFIAGLRAEGVPEDFIWLLTELFTVVLDGRNTPVVDGVRQALGREPRDFTTYVRDAAATGVWSSSVSA